MIPHDESLRAQMTSNLAAHRRVEHALDGRRHAAVAIVVVDSTTDVGVEDAYDVGEAPLEEVPGDTDGLDGRVTGVGGGAAFLLCRRSARLNSHARQWALPGGRLDAGESPEQAALRELHEELGLLLPDDAVIGLLDDYPTRSGYVITPVVVWAPGHVELVPQPDEVAHVYRIGLRELCRDDSPRFVSIPESDRPVVQLPIGGDLIHAPTAAVLVQFRWVAIDGRADARVDGFEQPVFAWR